MTDARRVLLERLIDDAGLFPPASLDLPEALAEHDRHRRGPWARLLGRFLCPASRLDALAASGEHRDALAVGVILDGAGAAVDDFEGALAADLETVAKVTARRDWLRVDAVELRLPAPAASAVDDVMTAVAVSLPETVAVYIEAPRSTDAASLDATLRVLAAHRARSSAAVGAPGAKVRCGGTLPGSVPAPEVLAGFVARAVATGTPFKATAGLHHAAPTVDPATGDTMHGFLHLAAVSALLTCGAISETDAAGLLADRDPGAVSLDGDGIVWRGWRAGTDVIRRCRTTAYHGHGSCSFDEPVADLVALGVLDGCG